MRTCPRCGRDDLPDDVHFCSCGEFLAWDDERRPEANGGGGTATAVVPATRVVDTPAPAGAPEEVSLRLFRPDRPLDDVAVALQVAAGGRTTLIARVRNQSSIVDSYALTVEGLPDGWWSVDRPTAYLLPLGSREGYEEDVVIALHPPRTPEAEAREWSFTVVVASQSHDTRVARETASVTIEAYWQVAAVARPTVVTGLRRQTVLADVTNTGNAELPVVVSASDSESRCRFDFPLGSPVAVQRGATLPVPVVVRPRRPRLIGRPFEHRLELVAQKHDDPDLVARCAAVYRQRPWIAWWMPLILLLLIVIAVILYLFWPHTSEVPDLRKERSAFAAQKKLEHEHLTLDPKIRRVQRRGVRPGTVVDQAPAPGKEVKHGREVSIVVAAGRTRVEVPKVIGLGVAEADQRLQKAGLTLGAVQPEIDPKARVGTQVPKAGVMRQRGSPVNVVLVPPKKKGDEKKDEEKGKEKTGAAGGAPLPAVAGGSAAEAVAALKKAGLDPQLEFRIDPEKRGTVLGTDPPEGEPPPEDGKVKVIVSAGFPRIAYDTGSDVRVVSGVTGKLVDAAADASVATGGSWAADGIRLAYTSAGGKLFVARPGSGERARRIPLRGGRRAVHAAFAPRTARTVLAFVDRSGDGDAVCWIDITRRVRPPSCRPRAARRLDGLVWSPDGRQILAPRAGNPALVRLETDSAWSSNARDWSGGEKRVTPAEPGKGVRAVAFPPAGSDEERLALVTNLESPDYRVALAKPDDLKELEGAEYLQVQGCDVAWRPDGAELAVAQAGASCDAGAVGPLVRVRPADPLSLQTVALLGQHPAWQPIDLNPGPRP